MAKDAHDVGRQTIMRRYAEARAARLPEMTIERAVHDICQNNEDTKVAAQEFNVVR